MVQRKCKTYDWSLIERKEDQKMIKFKTRTEQPKAIRLAFTDEDMDAVEFEKRMKWRGWFCIGYHYMLHENGEIEKVMDSEQYADTSLPHWKDSIYVIVMSVTISDVQKHALSMLAETLGIPIENGD